MSASSFAACQWNGHATFPGGTSVYVHPSFPPPVDRPMSRSDDWNAPALGPDSRLLPLPPMLQPK